MWTKHAVYDPTNSTGSETFTTFRLLFVTFHFSLTTLRTSHTIGVKKKKADSYDSDRHTSLSGTAGVPGPLSQQRYIKWDECGPGGGDVP